MERSKDHFCVHVVPTKVRVELGRGGGRNTCATVSQDRQAENELYCQYVSVHSNRGPI